MLTLTQTFRTVTKPAAQTATIDGTADDDFANIAGACAAALILSNSITANARHCGLVATNSFGFVINAPASAVVAIGAPASATIVAGVAVNTVPFTPTPASQQWPLGGLAIAVSNLKTFRFANNVAATDANVILGDNSSDGMPHPIEFIAIAANTTAQVFTAKLVNFGGVGAAGMGSQFINVVVGRFAPAPTGAMNSCWFCATNATLALLLSTVAIFGKSNGGMARKIYGLVNNFVASASPFKATNDGQFYAVISTLDDLDGTVASISDTPDVVKPGVQLVNDAVEIVERGVQDGQRYDGQAKWCSFFDEGTTSPKFRCSRYPHQRLRGAFLCLKCSLPQLLYPALQISTSSASSTTQEIPFAGNTFLQRR